MYSKLRNEDYIFDSVSGTLIKKSCRLDYVFGSGIESILKDLNTFEKALFDYDGRPLVSKIENFKNRKEFRLDCLMKVGEDFLEVRDMFWQDKLTGQIKGYLFLKKGRLDFSLTWESLLMNLENFHNPYLIFDEKLEEILVANRKILEIIPFDFSSMGNSFPLSKLFFEHEEYLKVMDWLSDGDQAFTYSLKLNLGMDFPNWFKIEMLKVEIDGLQCVSFNIIDINDMVVAEQKLAKSNKLLNELVKNQQRFLSADSFEKPFSELLEIIINQSGATLGFLGRVKAIPKIQLKLDAVTDFSKMSKTSSDLFNDFKKKGFLFEHPDNFIEDCLVSKKAMIINDFPNGRKIEKNFKGHPRLMNFLGIPVLQNNAVVGLIGLSNKNGGFSHQDVEFLDPIISFYSALIDVVRIREESQEIKRQKEENEYLLTSTLKNTNDCIFILDKDFSLSYYSPSFDRVFGIHSEEEIVALVKGVLKKKSISSKKTIKVQEKIELENRTIWFDLSLNPIFSEAGEVSKLLGIVRDATDMVNYQQKLEEALQQEKNLNAFKSQFLSIISHEFKTPLTIIKSSLDIMNIYTRSIAEPDEIKPRLSTKIQKIEREINMLNRLVNEVLQVELIDSGVFSLKKKRFQAVDFIYSAVNKFNLGEKVNFINKLPLDHEVHWDPVLMECVLENLIENAVKYGDNKPFDLRVFQDKGKTQIEVEDYGIGIPTNELDNIFQPFYRAKNAESIKGTGFGLVAVEKFVFQHDGYVEVESKLGKGTKFVIKI